MVDFKSKTLEGFKSAAQALSAQLGIMNNRDKGEVEEVVDTQVTIEDYGFLSGNDGDFVVFIIKEDKQRFYFGGSVLTAHIQTLDSDGYGEAIREHGLPVKFEKKVSKNKRGYMNAVLFPED